MANEKRSETLERAFVKVQEAAREGQTLVRMPNDRTTLTRMKAQAVIARDCSSALVEAIDLALGAEAVLEKATR